MQYMKPLLSCLEFEKVQVSLCYSMLAFEPCLVPQPSSIVHHFSVSLKHMLQLKKPAKQGAMLAYLKLGRKGQMQNTSHNHALYCPRTDLSTILCHIANIRSNNQGHCSKKITYPPCFGIGGRSVKIQNHAMPYTKQQTYDGFFCQWRTVVTAAGQQTNKKKIFTHAEDLISWHFSQD